MALLTKPISVVAGNSMAYRVVRLRREARRTAKLEDIFQARYKDMERII